MSKTPVPTVGRIVHVYHKAAPTPRRNGGSFAAVVTEVHGPTCITVTAFYPMGSYPAPYSALEHKDVTNGIEPYWVWPLEKK